MARNNRERILLYLLDHFEATAADIAAGIGAHRTTVASHIRRLIAQGYVVKDTQMIGNRTIPIYRLTGSRRVSRTRSDFMDVSN